MLRIFMTRKCFPADDRYLLVQVCSFCLFCRRSTVVEMKQKEVLKGGKSAKEKQFFEG